MGTTSDCNACNQLALPSQKCGLWAVQLYNGGKKYRKHAVGQLFGFMGAASRPSVRVAASSHWRHSARTCISAHHTAAAGAGAGSQSVAAGAGAGAGAQLSGSHPSGRSGAPSAWPLSSVQVTYCSMSAPHEVPLLTGAPCREVAERGSSGLVRALAWLPWRATAPQHGS